MMKVAVLLLATCCASGSVAARPGFALPRYTVALDAPASERWTAVATKFVEVMPAVLSYLRSMVPAWALPLLFSVADHLEFYYSAEKAAEINGLAAALKVPVGELVIVNLIMQIESVGINCSNWNTTGPTTKDDPGCTAVDPSQKWCYCKAALAAGAPLPRGGLLPPPPRSGPGLCTSIVAQTAEGRIVHGRNLDWNLPAPVRRLLIDIDFTRGGQTVFTGTGVVGFIGVINGMVSSAGGGGYSVSINARGKGGTLLDNLLQALAHHSTTPSEKLRAVLETQTDFESAVHALGEGALVDEIYFVVAGSKPGEGAVLSRGRNKVDDTWRLNASEPDGWFRAQTNYDHWHPVPAADNRRGPAIAAMRAIGQSKVTLEAVRGVVHTPPVYNDHTDYTGLFEPATGAYNSTGWLDAPNA